jgi:plastocyanin
MANTNRTAAACIALLAASTLLIGCKVDSATHSAESIDKSAVPSGGNPAQPRIDVPVGHATIAGTVDFTGKPPAKILIDTSMDPACAMGSNSGPVYTEQYVVDDGHLANVFVYVKSGPPAAMQSGVIAQPVPLDQKGCQYIPHVIGVVQGGSVRFMNSDITMHNIHTMPTVVGNQPIDISQGPRGTPVTKQFMKPELMIPVRCNNHPWMNAFINVAPTPFFAVSDARGRFTISGLPAGNYVIGAVHEKLGEKDINVTVPATGTTKASFTFAAQ